MKAAHAVFALALASALATVRTARADDDEKQTTIDPSDRADPASYRGRTNPPSAVQVLAWIPRVVFFPLYVVTEWVLRQPLYAITSFLDHSNAIRYLRYRVFFPTPDFWWFPTWWVDLGTAASVGLEMHFRNLLARHDQSSLVASTGGLYFYHFAATERFDVGAAYFGARGDYVTRKDRSFYGFGPYSDDVETHFRQTTYEAEGFVGVGQTNHFTLRLSEGFRGERSGPGNDASIETRFSPASIPAYGEPVDLAVTRAHLEMDTRESRELGGGARFVGDAMYARDVERPTRAFVTASADGRVAFEVSKPDRILSLRGYFADSVPLGSDPVPFMDQPMLGFDKHLGFEWGRFRGESAVMAELQYRYPIAYFVDALWTLSFGNVFARDLSDFDAKALTTSFSLGLRTRRAGGSPLEVAVGFGTTRFDQEFAIQSVRVYAGIWDGP